MIERWGLKAETVTMDNVAIAGRLIGPNHPPYVIAEMSGNHNGDIQRAFALIKAARDAGADAVKLQTYTADTITIDHDGPGFRLDGGLWHGRTLHDLYREAHTPWDWHEPLFRCAEDLGIAIFSSPFDPTAVDLLAGLKAPAYKIASFELVDLPLIQYAAQQGKPIIMSTGMAGLDDIAAAVETVQAAGIPVILLHCTSGYPTPPEECDLRTIPWLSNHFHVPVGLSDHTMGVAVPVAAVALGAVVIEKHFTLARADGGVDSQFSLEPAELAELVRTCRTAYAALGQVDFAVKNSEAAMTQYRRSLYVTRDVAPDAVIGPEDVRSIRPGFGLPPKYLPDILGRRAARPLRRGEPVDWTMVQP